MNLSSPFLTLPLEVRFIIYKAYFGTWSCIIGSTGLHSFVSRPSGAICGLSIGLLLACKQVYEEISAHQCFHKSFTGITKYTRGCCLSRLHELGNCWILTSTKHVISHFLDDGAVRDWHPRQHFPQVETVEIQDTQYWSFGLSLHANIREAVRLFETKEIEYQMLWCDESLKTLREVVNRDGINIVVHTFLTVRDRPTCNALYIVSPTPVRSCFTIDKGYSE